MSVIEIKKDIDSLAELNKELGEQVYDSVFVTEKTYDMLDQILSRPKKELELGPLKFRSMPFYVIVDPREAIDESKKLLKFSINLPETLDTEIQALYIMVHLFERWGFDDETKERMLKYLSDRYA